jgi:hypothetical protein
MKNPKYIQLVKGTTTLLLGTFLLTRLNALAQGQPAAVGMDSDYPHLSTNAPPPGFATRWDYVKSFTNQQDIFNATRAGLLNGDESIMAMQALVDKMESKPMDIYGKVVDQNGQPVTGAKARGFVDFGISGSEEHDTVTDAQGQFHFLGLYGKGLGIRLQKDGYEYGYKIPYQRPGDYLPDSNNPVVITMWKLRGAEPMIHTILESRVPYNGTSAIFNLMTGKKSADGDLKITLSRFPLKIHRGRDKYDWTVKIEPINGALIVENDQYPNWAPENGYQSSFETGMSSNSVSWSRELSQNFYTKDKQGKYGRLLIDLFTDSERPDTGITIQTWVNPSGSQNLEFDPQKQIR